MTIARKAPCLLLSLLFAAALAAAVRAMPQQADPPAGVLLVASRTIEDPRFYHSVILLVRHDGNGALGLAINNPLGERSLAALLADADGGRKEDGAIAGKTRVFLGGPVQPEFGFVVHSADYHRPETLTLGGKLAVTASQDVLRDIGHHKGPAKYLFVLGYAGWGAGQLESEIAHHAWFTAPADPDLVFDADRASLWQKALDRRTRDL